MRQRSAHDGGRDWRAVRAEDSLDDLDRETTTPTDHAQRLSIARSTAAKTMIVTDEQFFHREAAREYARDELLGRVQRELAGERNYNHVIDGRLCEQLELLRPQREQGRRRRRIHDIERMGIKREY